MAYGLLADFVGLVHASFVLFVVGGLFSVLAGWAFGWDWTRNPAFRWAHLAAIAFVVADTALGRLCPLTVLENDLRALARQSGVGPSFVAHWLERLLYYRAPHWVFLSVYAAFGAAVLAAFVLHPPRKRATVTRPMERRKNSDVLIENLPLKGKKVADIGCGDGSLVRLMAKEGADVVGVDCGKAQLDLARSHAKVANETFLEGVGENLPFEDASFDAVVFFNSLHHVAVPAQKAAIAEAGRVLKSGGTLYIAEPLPEGPNFEVGRAIEDETEVRAKALEAIRGAGKTGFRAVKETTYIHTMEAASFEAFRERHIRTDPSRAAAFEKDGEKVRQLFHRMGKPTDKGFAFDQPIRVNILRKA